MSGNQVTVSWTTPTQTSGTTSYTVTALEDGVPSGQGCVAASPATSCIVNGLAPGVTYTFTVEATNGAGSVVSTTPSNPATPLADSKVFSAQSPTASGVVNVAITGGDCTGFERVQLQSDASAGAAAEGRSFPHGVLDFVLRGCMAGSTAEVTVTYPGTSLPQGAQYWKRLNGTWVPFAYQNPTGATVILKLTDGDTGDDDGGKKDGRIVDPGGLTILALGPGGASGIPALSQWGAMLLAALMGLLAWRRRA